MIRAADIVKRARGMVNVKFNHGGRNKKHGLDCAGLVIAALTDLGYSIPEDQKNYSMMPDGRLVDIVRKHATEIPFDDAMPGDIGLFWFDPESRLEQHLGVISNYPIGVRGLGIIHATEKVGKVVEHVWTDKWTRRLCGVYRLRGVAPWQH